MNTNLTGKTRNVNPIGGNSAANVSSDVNLTSLKALMQEYKSLKGERAIPDISEGFHSLLTDKQRTIDDYRDFILDLLSVLTNPEVSEKLEPVHRLNGGSMLYDLEGFLHFLQCEDIDLMLHEMELHYSKSLSEHRVSTLVREYQKKIFILKTF